MGGFSLRCLEIWLGLHGNTHDCAYGGIGTSAFDRLWDWDLFSMPFATVVAFLTVTVILYRFFAMIYRWLVRF